MNDTATTPQVQISFFDEMFACDRCNREAHAAGSGQLPEGWTLVGRGFVCTRSSKRKCEPIELHYCEVCSNR